MNDFNTNVSTAKDKLVQAWNENPTMVIAVASGLMMATSRLIEAISGVASKRAYAKRFK